MKTDSRDAPSSRQDSIEATAKMLPCPNCGETNVDAAYSRGEEFLNAGCMVCGMTGPDSHTPLDAADRWNALPRGTSARLETGAPSCVNRTGCETPNDCREHKYCRSPHNKASPAATPRTDELFQRHVAEQREMRPGISYVVTQELAIRQVRELLDLARTLERECAELLGQHRAANAAIALQDRTIAELRGKLEEAQDLLESAHDSRDLYRKRAEEAEAKLSTARQDALEEAAKVADGYNYGPCGQYDYGYTDAQAKADERAGQIADDIRALKEEA